MNSVEAIQDFRVDPTVFTLKGGGRPDCGGMVLVVGWSWGIDPATHYAQLAADLAALDPALHVYDARHLHCTVATLSRCLWERYDLLACCRTDLPPPPSQIVK